MSKRSKQFNIFEKPSKKINEFKMISVYADLYGIINILYVLCIFVYT